MTVTLQLLRAGEGGGCPLPGELFSEGEKEGNRVGEGVERNVTLFLLIVVQAVPRLLAEGACCSCGWLACLVAWGFSSFVAVAVFRFLLCRCKNIGIDRNES